MVSCITIQHHITLYSILMPCNICISYVIPPSPLSPVLPQGGGGFPLTAGGCENILCIYKYKIYCTCISVHKYTSCTRARLEGGGGGGSTSQPATVNTRARDSISGQGPLLPLPAQPKVPMATERRNAAAPPYHDDRRAQTDPKQ